LNGGYAATCTAQKAAVPAPPPPGPMVNGLCGSANGVPDVSPPAHSLCAAGTVTPLSGEGPWNWNCLGENGGMTVSCTAPLQPPAPVVGACGGASGVPTLVAPQSGLCAAGIASAVSGAGPWTWSCSGINGGGAVGCVGPLAESGGTGSLPSPVTPSGVASLPQQIAPPMPIEGGGLVTPQLPAGPLPPLESGSLPPPPGAALEPVPQSAPGLPSDANPLLPPPIRDNNPPPRALRPPAINSQGQMIPGNHFVIPAELSSLPFATGSENIGRDDLPTLHKLVQLLRNHGGVRVTLTAYAALGQSTSPRDARRLSLARALAVRDYLTAKGISSARINVRAMGANVESGDMDRVDISAN
ncbi:MAG TPA: OmpA family protein, partial [Alphaproteobacteria bacterium]|nr:OmpA family protein [Alphaproteobacteria bacterium]